MIYGSHEYDFSYEVEGLKLSVERRNGHLYYSRECNDERVEKILASSGGHIIINPVEPINLPREVTYFLEIDFEKPVVIEPGANEKAMVKFPIEIGVFVAKNKQVVLDVFTLTKPKYVLYGTPKSGVICRWYTSDVYSEMPSLNPLKEGIIKITFRNTSNDWVEVSKAVFDGYSMKIYYGDVVAMLAEMKIISRSVAETTFIDKPLKDGLKKSLELYTARMIPVVERRGYLMEWGLK
jgi:hypothetical protein